MCAHQPHRSSRLQEAETGLQALGFSEYEARIYLALLKTNPATAYELSKAANVPRSNTYGTLESLSKKGVVQPVSEQPTRYVPQEPAQVFGRIEKDTSERCRDLIERLQHVREATETHIVWSIAGEARVHEKITEMMRAAREHIWIKASEDMLERHVDDLKDAAGRSVSVLIIFYGTRPERFRVDDRIKVFLHDANGVRIGYADNLFTLTTDFATALTVNLHGDVYGAYTRSKPIVTMADTIIRHDVYMAEILARFRAEIEAVFGRYLLALRRTYFTPEQYARTLETLAAVDPTALEDQPGNGPPGSPQGSRAARRRPPSR